MHVDSSASVGSSCTKTKSISNGIPCMQDSRSLLHVISDADNLHVQVWNCQIRLCQSERYSSHRGILGGSGMRRYIKTSLAVL